MRKKHTLILFLFLTSLLTFAQDKNNQVDANGKRHGIWKKLYRNGNTRYTGEFNHGKEIGTFNYYAITGEKKPIVIKNFQKNSTRADVRFFSKDGVLESEGNMQKKNRIGEWIYFFNDGKTILSKENYINGLLDGKLEVFYKNGKLTELAHYQKGKLNGQRIRYGDTGKETENISYKEDVIHGSAIIYDEKGDVYARGSYTNGIKSGVWEFNMDGEMVKVEADKIRLKK